MLRGIRASCGFGCSNGRQRGKRHKNPNRTQVDAPTGDSWTVGVSNRRKNCQMGVRSLPRWNESLECGFLRFAAPLLNLSAGQAQVIEGHYQRLDEIDRI